MSLRNSTRRSGNNASSSQVVDTVESTEVDTTEEEKISLVELLRAVRALEKDNAALRTENQLFRRQIDNLELASGAAVPPNLIQPVISESFPQESVTAVDAPSSAACFWCEMYSCLQVR